MKKKLSPQTTKIIEEKIQQLEGEDKYIKDFLRGVNGSIGGNSSSILNQKGTSIPIHYGLIDTFITNPSMVGIGVLSRMIETDDTVKASVEFKSAMMLSKIGDYTHEDKNIEEFVNGFLEDMSLPSWKDAKEAMSSHYGFGFSVSEKLYKINEKNQKVPYRIKTYHPSTIVFEVDPYGDITEDGIIQFVIQQSQFSNPNQYFPKFNNGFLTKNPFETPVDDVLPYRLPFINNYGLVRLPKNKCIHHTNSALLSFGSPYGKTSVRTAHLAWQLKVFFMKQMGVAGKRQASPFLWATAPFANNKTEIIDQKTGQKKMLNPIEALDNILAERQNDDSIVTGPESLGYNISAIAATIDLNQYLDVLNHLDKYIFRAFLLPSLIMTDGSGGSRALGDKHFEMVDYIATNDAQTFMDNLIQQLIKPAVEMNFGSQEQTKYKKKYGSFSQKPQSLEERKQLSEMFVNLANAGYMKAYDKTDNDFVRTSIHIPAQEKSFFDNPMPNFKPVDNKDNDADNDLGDENNDQ